MNERIKQIAEQSGFIFWKDEAWKPENASIDWSSNYDNELKKFAELIVEECIGCCDEVDRINQYHIEKDFIDPELGPKECIEVIKKHFGVEQ
jgi:hypothetical protein